MVAVAGAGNIAVGADGGVGERKQVAVGNVTLLARGKRRAKASLNAAELAQVGRKD